MSAHAGNLSLHMGHFTSRLMQNAFVASRIELKGWGSWRNIRETGITLGGRKRTY